jgi:hypothetical protein
MWNKEKLPEEWKESIIVLSIRRAIKKIEVGTSILPTTYKILSNILLPRLAPYAKEITGDQCGFQCNRSNNDHIFYIHLILQKKWEYSEAVHQLFIDFKKAYDSVRREGLYNILIEFGIPKKPVKLIKICLNGIYKT